MSSDRRMPQDSSQFADQVNVAARKFHDNAVRSLPEEPAAEIAARTLALPEARVEDLSALLTSAGER